MGAPSTTVVRNTMEEHDVERSHNLLIRGGTVHDVNQLTTCQKRRQAPCFDAQARARVTRVEHHDDGDDDGDDGIRTKGYLPGSWDECLWRNVRDHTCEILQLVPVPTSWFPSIATKHPTSDTTNHPTLTLPPHVSTDQQAVRHDTITCVTLSPLLTPHCPLLSPLPSPPPSPLPAWLTLVKFLEEPPLTPCAWRCLPPPLPLRRRTLASGAS